MNKLRSIHPTQVLIAAVMLIGVGVLTLALRDVVRESVVIPLAYAVWLADLLLKSLPQSLFLAVLVLVSAVVVLRGLLYTSPLPRQFVPRQDRGGFRSRLDFWTRRLNALDASPFAQEQSAQEMRNLVLRALADQLDPDEVAAAVRNGALAVPPEVGALLLNWRDWLSDDAAASPRASPGAWWKRLRWERLRWERLREVLRTDRRSAAESARINRKLEAVVEFLETQVTPVRQTADEPDGAALPPSTLSRST